MNGSRAVAVAAVAGLALTVVPVTAALGASSKHHTPVAPATGQWDLYNVSNVGQELAGTMVVTAKHRFVKSFHGTLGPAAPTPCGTGKISVKGKLKIIDAKGQGEYGSYNEWAVGHNTPTADPVISPEKVTLVHAGKPIKAKMYLTFIGRKGHTKKADAGGEILYAGGQCDLSFETKKH